MVIEHTILWIAISPTILNKLMKHLDKVPKQLVLLNIVEFVLIRQIKIKKIHFRKIFLCIFHLFVSLWPALADIIIFYIL